MGPTSNKPMLWGGRFKGGLDPLMAAFNLSITVDKAMWAQDIRGSIAWARANMHAGILSTHEFSEIERGFGIIAQEWQDNTFQLLPSDEDIYTANERRLGEIIGVAIGGKLHTGRSRNEQSATDQRMYLRDRVTQMRAYLEDLIRVLIQRAESEIDLIMPGYTHLQRAQPVRWSHYLLSYAFALLKDLDRASEVVTRANESPYGSGAIAGNSFGIDREKIAQELGFSSIMHNSMEAVSDRYYIVDALQWCAVIMMHLSRLSEDLILYGSHEFHFVQLSDAYSTGSSLMPQKKNSDSLELIRGRSGEVVGLMTGLLVTIKGLPSTYNKDLQGSLESLIKTLDVTSDSMRIMTGVLSTLSTFPEHMRAALSADMLATDLADYLVLKGVPFRETHHIAGQVVALAEKENVKMDELSLQQIQGVDARFGDDVMDCFDYERSIERKNVPGGTSKSSVVYQIGVIKAQLEKISS